MWFLSLFVICLSFSEVKTGPFVGRVFAELGPNCFSSALKIAGFYPGFRGVDGGEFTAFTENFCKKVVHPQNGDLGVFEAPGFGFIHAYVYLKDNLGIHKPGVDYLGATPIQESSIEGIAYQYLASRECRRYSTHFEECSNLHYYLHCQKPSGKTLNEQKTLDLFNQLDRDVESFLYFRQLSDIQQKKHILSELDFLERATAMESPSHLSNYFLQRLVSLKKQMVFLNRDMP